jgi:hypothetical protein
MRRSCGVVGPAVTAARVRKGKTPRGRWPEAGWRCRGAAPRRPRRRYAPRRPAEGPREGAGRSRGCGAAEARRGVLRSGGERRAAVRAARSREGGRGGVRSSSGLSQRRRRGAEGSREFSILLFSDVEVPWTPGGVDSLAAERACRCGKRGGHPMVEVTIGRSGRMHCG